MPDRSDKKVDVGFFSYGRSIYIVENKIQLITKSISINL